MIFGEGYSALYSKITIETAPRRRRRSLAQFEKTPEWALMKADLEKGIAGDEALQVLLTEEDKRNYKIRSRISVARFVKKYLAVHNLPYTVRSFRRDEGDFVIVQNKRASQSGLGRSPKTGNHERGPC
jgi:hypothetical protein